MYLGEFGFYFVLNLNFKLKLCYHIFIVFCDFKFQIKISLSYIFNLIWQYVSEFLKKKIKLEFLVIFIYLKVLRIYNFHLVIIHLCLYYQNYILN